MSIRAVLFDRVHRQAGAARERPDRLVAGRIDQGHKVGVANGMRLGVKRLLSYPLSGLEFVRRDAAQASSLLAGRSQRHAQQGRRFGVRGGMERDEKVMQVGMTEFPGPLVENVPTLLGLLFADSAPTGLVGCAALWTGRRRRGPLPSEGRELLALVWRMIEVGGPPVRVGRHASTSTVRVASSNIYGCQGMVEFQAVLTPIVGAAGVMAAEVWVQQSRPAPTVQAQQPPVPFRLHARRCSCGQRRVWLRPHRFAVAPAGSERSAWRLVPARRPWTCADRGSRRRVITLDYVSRELLPPRDQPPRPQLLVVVPA